MPIQGKKKSELKIDTILERASEAEIFSKFMPWKWEINQPCISPFPRPGKGIEKNPSFIIGNRYGNLNFKDFGLNLGGDVFAFVKELHSLPNLDAVLKTIDSILNLGISDGLQVRSGPISDIKQPEATKRNTLLQIQTRKFTNSELHYWNEYYQDVEDLKREEIYSIKKAYLNKKLLNLADLRFGYFYSGMWKIYQPMENKRKKWLSNVPLTYLDGKDNIKNCETAWVTKSKKDKMLLLKLYNCVISTQNESISCFSQENVDFIKNNSKKQVVLYDADEVGVRSCQEITKKFNMDYCNVPKSYLAEGLKDFGDVCAKYGIGEVEKILKNKGILL